MTTYKFKRETSIEEVIETLGYKLGIDSNRICFDSSRCWGLYVNGGILGYNVQKFGAYRNYNGGGVRGPLSHNGEKERGNYTNGVLFRNALKRIEEIINQETKGEPSWEQNTGVLL